MPNVELLSIARKTGYVAAVHADPEFAVIAIRHPVVLVGYGPNSDL